MFFWTPKRTKNRPQPGGIGCRVLSRVVCEMICGSAFSRNIVHCIVVAISKLPPPLYNTQHSLKANPLKSSLQSLSPTSPTPPMCNAQYISLASLATHIPKECVCTSLTSFNMMGSNSRVVGAGLTLPGKVVFVYSLWGGVLARRKKCSRARPQACLKGRTRLCFWALPSGNNPTMQTLTRNAVSRRVFWATFHEEKSQSSLKKSGSSIRFTLVWGIRRYRRGVPFRGRSCVCGARARRRSRRWL